MMFFSLFLSLSVCLSVSISLFLFTSTATRHHDKMPARYAFDENPPGLTAAAALLLLSSSNEPCTPLKLNTRHFYFRSPRFSYGTQDTRFLHPSSLTGARGIPRGPSWNTTTARSLYYTIMYTYICIL